MNLRLKRALITEGMGFIESHLAEALLKNHYPVRCSDDLSTGSFKNIEHLLPHLEFHFVIETIMNENVMDRLMSYDLNSRGPKRLRMQLNNYLRFLKKKILGVPKEERKDEKRIISSYRDVLDRNPN